MVPVVDLQLVYVPPDTAESEGAARARFEVATLHVHQPLIVPGVAAGGRLLWAAPGQPRDGVPDLSHSSVSRAHSQPGPVPGPATVASSSLLFHRGHRVLLLSCPTPAALNFFISYAEGVRRVAGGPSTSTLSSCSSPCSPPASPSR